MRFDANVDPHLPWSFKPEQLTQVGHVGEVMMAKFKTTNLANHPITGRAVLQCVATGCGQVLHQARLLLLQFSGLCSRVRRSRCRSPYLRGPEPGQSPLISTISKRSRSPTRSTNATTLRLTTESGGGECPARAKARGIEDGPRRREARLSTGRNLRRGRSFGAISALVLALGAVIFMKGFVPDDAKGLAHFFFARHQPVAAFRRRDPRLLHDVRLVVGRHQGKPRGLSHADRSDRPALWDDPLHRFRGHVLRGVVLGVLRTGVVSP